MDIDSIHPGEEPQDIVEKYLGVEVIPQKPHVLQDDLIANFGLQKFFKEHKVKKSNRALQTSLKEIVFIEKNLRTPEFVLSISQKQQLFS